MSKNFGSPARHRFNQAAANARSAPFSSIRAISACVIRSFFEPPFGFPD
jgi:hypothetical protein